MTHMGYPYPRWALVVTNSEGWQAPWCWSLDPSYVIVHPVCLLCAFFALCCDACVMYRGTPMHRRLKISRVSRPSSWLSKTWSGCVGFFFLSVFGWSMGTTWTGSAGDRKTKAAAAASSGPWSKVKNVLTVQQCKSGREENVGGCDTQWHHQLSLQIQLATQQKSDRYWYY